MKEKTALIAGSSGLVGNELLQFLLSGEDYEKIYALVRRPLEVDHPKLIEVFCDFDQLEEVQEYFAVDDVFCCLGTTLKKAKTKEAMYKVDVEYPLAISKLAKEKGASHFLLISSMNANTASFLWYPAMKGKLEEEVKRIPYDAISILRPSLLLGNRKEFRLAESITGKMFVGLSKLMGGRLSSQIAIEAKTVALAMYKIAQEENKGIMIYSSSSLEHITR